MPSRDSGHCNDPLFEFVEYPFRRCSRSANSILVFSIFFARSRSLGFRERLAPLKNRELLQRANNDAADWRTALELEAEFCIVHGRDQTKQLLRPRLSSVSFALDLFLPSLYFFLQRSSSSVVIVIVVAAVVFVASSNVSVVLGFRSVTLLLCFGSGIRRTDAEYVNAGNLNLRDKKWNDPSISARKRLLEIFARKIRTRAISNICRGSLRDIASFTSSPRITSPVHVECH